MKPRLNICGGEVPSRGISLSWGDGGGSLGEADSGKGGGIMPPSDGREKSFDMKNIGGIFFCSSFSGMARECSRHQTIDYSCVSDKKKIKRKENLRSILHCIYFFLFRALFQCRPYEKMT